MHSAPMGNAYIKLIEKELAPLLQRIAALEREVKELKAANDTQSQSRVQRFIKEVWN